ncbi:MAG: GAF domain-containing protein [Cyclobacteriaceae bacterium]|nr:GAF domain-containing protein [Cyclobacteriaceae bacterium]MCH8517120.1 GAF domain-containing protein [Cyclobacteriaceae bacterium]
MKPKQPKLADKLTAHQKTLSGQYFYVILLSLSLFLLFIAFIIFQVSQFTSVGKEVVRSFQPIKIEMVGFKKNISLANEILKTGKTEKVDQKRLKQVLLDAQENLSAADSLSDFINLSQLDVYLKELDGLQIQLQLSVDSLIHHFNEELNEQIYLSDFIPSDYLEKEMIQDQYFEIKKINNRYKSFFEKNTSYILSNNLQKADHAIEYVDDEIVLLRKHTDRRLNILVLSIVLLFLTISSGLLWVNYKVTKKLNEELRLLDSKLSEFSKGNLPKISTNSNTEFGPIFNNLNHLSENLQQIKDYAEDIGEMKFDGSIKVFNDQGVLGTSLAQMRESLKIIAEQDKTRNLKNETLTKFNRILRDDKGESKLLYDALATELVRSLNACQAGIFLTSEREEKLQLNAMYAYDRNKYDEKEYAFGQSLVGQCYLEKETIYLSEIPNEYISIGTGLGKTRPNYLLIVPMMVNEKVYGVLEISSFHSFPKHKIELIEELGENIALTIESINRNRATKTLLIDSQEKTERLQSAEEEMRQNMEEMQATQEEMARSTLYNSKEINRLTALIDDLDTILIILNENNEIEFVNKKAEELLKIKREELKGQSIQDYADPFLNVKSETKQEVTLKNKQGTSVRMSININKKRIDQEILYLLQLKDV